VYWELDYALRLFPLPHLLVLADHAEQYQYKKAFSGGDATGDCCTVVNPGSFSSDYSFVVYQPATRTVEFSRVTL
jgi:DNA polymerase epsilon subunit 2